MPQRLRVLLIKDGGGTQWVAQCLEHDIAAQATTIKQARAEFERAIAAEIAYSLEAEEAPLENIPPAPQFYWNLFETEGERLRTDDTESLGIAEPPTAPATSIPHFDEIRVA